MNQDPDRTTLWRLGDAVRKLGASETFIRAGRPATNGADERVQRTILEESWRPSFARSVVPKLTGVVDFRGLRGPSPRFRTFSTILLVAVVVGTLLPGVGPNPAQAKDPVAKCQDKLFRKEPPAHKDCVVLKAGTLDVGINALPAGFTESVVWGGLTNPTNIEFAADGRVFVAEKSGVIKVFDSVTATTPTVFSALTTNVHNFWDRGTLGLALDPSLTNPALPLRPWIYVLYAYDHVLGGNGLVGANNDGCLTPPGPTTDGCLISGRLSRFTVNGSTISGGETVLIEDWCQQFPSHSIGSLGFGPDGALYVSGGDGASFNAVDYGAFGGSLANTPTPKNPCGDPPRDAMTPPTAEGGALRSQDLRTDGAPTADPATLDGAILRVDPVTGADFAGNPFAASSDANKRRVIAYGLRNPFRFELRPGTNELWVGDVGWSNWEEINRIANVSDTAAENFGWPCYEGAAAQGGYDSANLSLCESLYTAGPSAVTGPVYTYAHSGHVVGTETCPTGGSAIAGITFYPETGGNFPAAYRGGMFFADHNRNCIWWMAKGTDGQPDPATRSVFLAPAANPVDLEIGPDGALYYVDFDTSSIRKVAYAAGNQPPTAVAQANPTTGPAPLTVAFNGTGSTDPEGGALSYAWDLDGDGVFNDSTSATPTWVYQTQGNVTASLRVTDPGALSGTDSVVISVGNSPPTPVIQTPVAGTTAAVGELITFSGSATDAQDGTIPASQLSWLLRIQHCPSNCHAHDIQTFAGVASGSFSAPDHDYPSYLELILTATDSNGSTASATRRIDPKTVTLSMQTVPTGLSLSVNGLASTAPFSRTVIQGSSNSLSATTPQTVGGSVYSFGSWSDGGAATHTVTAASSGTYTATYVSTGTTITLTPIADAEIRANKPTKNFGQLATLSVKSGASRSYLKFAVPALTGTVQMAKLRVFVTNASTSGGSAYTVGSSWTETGITWNNPPPISGSPLATAGQAVVGAWVEFDVRPAIASSTTVSFALSDGVGNAVDYSSRTGGNPPQLVITTTP